MPTSTTRPTTTTPTSRSIPRSRQHQQRIRSTPNEVCGDEFTKTQNGFRVWSNNINTLSLANGLAQFRELCDTLHQHHVDIIALQELNLDTTQLYVRQQILQVLKDTFGAVKLITASTPTRTETTWKPGGVLLAVVGTSSHRVTSTQRDPLGRWCSATLTGRGNKQIRVYSVYQCVHANIKNAGEYTYFAQLWHLLRSPEVTSPNPREQLIRDLQTELTAAKRAKIDLIIMGDFNETLGTNPNLMASICANTELAEAIDHLHPSAEHIPTYIRGQRRLDYCLMSHSLLPSIAAAGINRFHEISESDHRALFLDLRVDHLFYLTTPIVSPGLRHIHSESAEAERFVHLVYSHLIIHNVFSKFDSFLKLPLDHPTPYVLANQIDTQLTCGILAAERKISRPPRPPWSEELHQASRQVRLWKIARSVRLNALDATDQLLSAADDARYNEPLPTNLKIIEQNLRLATTELRNIRCIAAEKRQQFLQTLKERIALRKTPQDMEAKQALQCIEKQLRSRKRFRTIRNVMEPSQPQALTKIIVTRTEQHINPLSEGPLLERERTAMIDTRAELEAAILERNRLHFAKAQGTPFTIPPLSSLRSDTNFKTNSDSHQQLPMTLPPGTFQETSMVVDILADTAQNPPPGWSDSIHFEDFIKGLLKWREATSTSPSGRHLGTYKTLLTVYLNSSGEFDRTSETSPEQLPDPMPSKYKAEHILRVMHGIASTAAKRGFYLQRWLRVINVMIYKEPGNFKLEKLRVIHLFEADFNLMVGILFGRRAMFHARDHSLIHSSQGGRLGSECMDVAFTKILHFSLAHLTKTPLGLFESDAEACFDRIVMRMAFMSFKAMGAPPKPLQMWEHTLYHIRHELRTGYGESTGSYRYTEESPIFGPGQGSRGGVAAVCAMTTILLRAFDRLGHGSTFCDPLQTKFAKTISKMFIDDASNYVNNFLQGLHFPTDQIDLTALLSEDAQIWERLLHTSGGKLRPDKCLYYLILWLFDEEGVSTLEPPDNDTQLTITTGQSLTQQHITHYPPQQAHRTLGVYVSPNFQTSTALHILQQKVQQYASRLFRGSLSKYDTWVCYFSCFIPKVAYGLAVMTHSSKDLFNLQRPAIAATLSKLGFRRTINRAIVFGSPLYGGLGLRDLYVEQGIAQLQLFIRHLRAESPQGELLQISISWWQLQAGVSWSLLQHPQPKLPFLPTTWLTSVRDFLATINGELTVTDATAEIPPPTRLADRYIMEAILDLPTTTTAELQACQRVRLFLGVTLLSELTSADGKSLTQEAWTGDRPRHTPLLWPFQPRPGPLSFRIWRRLLARAFLSGRTPRINATTKSLQLQCPLGHWLPSSRWLQSKWTSFYCYTTHRLYRRSEDDPSTFQSHVFITRGRLRNPKFQREPDNLSIPLPSSAIPVDATTQRDFINFPSIVRLQAPPPYTDPAYTGRRTFLQYVSSLPLWDRVLLQDVSFLDTVSADFRTLFRDPQVELILSSDGGAKDRLGSYGALIASQESPLGQADKILVEVGGIAFGDTPRSFRAESYGQLAILRLLLHLSLYLRCPIQCKCRFLLDNSGRLTRTRHILRHPQPSPRRCLLSEFDLDLQIRDTVGAMQLRTSDEHIHSHQDENQEAPDASTAWKIQLNTRCDSIATEHLQRQTDPILLVPFFPASKVALTVDRRTITGRIPSQLRHHCGSSRLYTKKRSQIQHLCRVHHWTAPQFHSIDWALFSAITNSKSSFPNRLIKIRWLNHLLPLHYRQHRMHLSPSSHCPSTCGCTSEDDDHLLRCPHPDRRLHISNLLLELRPLFDKYHVDPWLRQILFSVIAGIHPVTTFNLTALTLPYRALVDDQRGLGPLALFYGVFHTSWVTLQDHYLQTQHLPRERNQARHSVELIAHLFQATARRQWDTRNSHLHEQSDDHQPYARTLLLQETTQVYADLPQLLFLDRPAIHNGISLADRLQFTSPRLRHWLLLIRPTMRLSLRQARKRPAHTPDIRTFFHTVRPPEGTRPDSNANPPHNNI